MKIKIITVGRLKEDFYKSAAAEYTKRLSRFHKLTVTEIPEELKCDNPDEAKIKKALEAEGEKIAKSIGKGAYTIVLAINGEGISSEKLAKKMKSVSDSGCGEIDFIIGGSHGLCDEITASADFRLSFSKMTFTYQLSRVILLEQIYRASKINSGEAYHK